MAETLLETPLGPKDLRRRHTSPDSPLRAWSAADELLLAAIGTMDPGRLLIVNDAWGALSVGLDRWKPVVWSDSALERAAIEANLARNGGSTIADRVVTGDRVPEGVFDTVVLVVPKSLALLEWQCRGIAAVRGPSTRLLIGGMSRHVTRGVAESIEGILGPLRWNPARRKARVLEVEPATGASSAPIIEATAAFVTDAGIVVHEAPGVFSAGHLDVGTGLLLDEIGEAVPSPGGGRVADLGCGNGIIAATLGRQWPEASFDLIDVSDLSVLAAKATWQTNHADDAGRARFFVADGFPAGVGPYDVIVTNPPFHQGHAEDRGLTDRLLQGAAAHLVEGGIVVVVAQRHRELHRRLRRWFGRVETVSAHPSHVVFVAALPRRAGG